MTKKDLYQNLVTKFKKHRFSTPDLLNPHEIENFNFDVVNPWELWQGNLDAEIMLIGQDFADSESLKNNLQEDWKKEKSSSTNLALISFFKILGYPIPEICYKATSELPLFFTNAILGIKKSDVQQMSKPVKNLWIQESREYLRELIGIVQPKCIIVMGKTAYKAICNIYNIKPTPKTKDIIGTKIDLPDGKDLFVVQHCSPLGRVGRSLELQTGDWEGIRNKIYNSKQNTISGKLKEMVQLEELPQHLDTLSSRDWDRLFDLIPKIEETRSFNEFSDIIKETITVISELRINPVFDWMSWREGEAIATNSDYDYSQLDTITLCKLLAAIIRADKFSEGFLTGCFKRGVMVKILRALKNNVQGRL